MTGLGGFVVTVDKGGRREEVLSEVETAFPGLEAAFVDCWPEVVGV